MAILEESKKHLLDTPIVVTFFPDGSEYKFNDFDSLKKYITEEMEFWSSYRFGDINSQASKYNRIMQLVNQTEALIDSKEQIEYLNNIKNDLGNPSIFSSKSNFIKFVIRSWGDNLTVFKGIYDYYLGKSKEIIDADYLKGQLLGFYYKDTKNIKEIKKTFLTESFKKLFEDYTNIFNKTQIDYNLKIDKTDKILDKEINDSKKWFDKKQKEYDEYIANKNGIMLELEKLYQEKLRLEGPAAYWSTYKTQYKNSGLIWISLCTFIGIIISVVCLYLLHNFPEQLFTGDRLSIENTIRWTILLALLFSTLFYLFRLFMKLGLSSFHLSRDANERLQLTYLYLSLLKENVIDDKHRDIIIQSLFSRADTGLLKGDSSPTMPDSLVNQILKNISH